MKLLLTLLLLLGPASAVLAAQPAANGAVGSQEAEAFVAAYGVPANELLASHRWAKAAAQDLEDGVVHVLPNPPLGVESQYFSLFVRDADGQAFLIRQGGFSGELEFFGPVPLDGT